MIFIISGPGGVGKGTVVTRLLDHVPDLGLSRSWTTRPRRPGEAEDAYVFVDRDRFDAHRRAGGFLEWNELPSNGQLYGTPVPGSDHPGDLLLEIELNGARQVKERHPDAVMIFVLPPSRQALEDRLRGRGDDEESVVRRLRLGAHEMDVGPGLADHVVVNDDVDQAAARVADIIRGRRDGRSRSGA
ncbi:MAG: guanylate kinase [Actinomycetota bacterium]|nr:guanylate kinase [Actinomycetota bacterium]